MDAGEIFDTYVKFNLGYFFTKKIKLKGFLLLVNEKIPQDKYFNFAVKISSRDTEKTITRVEKALTNLGSLPSFYILPNTKPKNLETTLIAKGYSLAYSDVWMSFRKNIRPESKITEGFIIKRANRNEFLKVKEIFNEVFTKGEPGDPYKGLPHIYGEFLYDRITDTNRKFNSETYIALEGKKITGICSILYDKKNSMIDSLAVLPEFRNRGIGKALLITCVNRLHDIGIKDIIILTESGSKNEKIFEKIGFVKGIVSKIYRK